MAAYVVGGALLLAIAAAQLPRWIDWQVFALAFAGFGTLLLAGATLALVKSSDRNMRETRRLAQLAEREQDARLRPAVMLWHDVEWFSNVPHRNHGLPFHNTGGGPAINVDVQVYWHAGNCALATTSIGPGERTRLFARKPIPDFAETWGLIRYSDLLGRRWETRFNIETGPDGQPRFELRAYGLSALLPQLAHPAGWELDNALPRISVPPDPVP
ncbi:MAG TPA: hypothetical protein VG652_10675 [Gaiellaceae bacterium]|nr:hypothetical protein [Gaiellaceae bacterium]